MNSYATELRTRVQELVLNHVSDEDVASALALDVFALVEEERLRSFKNGLARGQSPRKPRRERDRR